MRRLAIAYLTNQYPKISHTFIRREIVALEKAGHRVTRYAIRPSGETLRDPADQAEARRTTYCLTGWGRNLAAASIGVALARPRRFLIAFHAALRMARVSERGSLRHLAYLAEACFLARSMEAAGITHVHVHFATNAATVARLLGILSDVSYSMTVHGPTEFDAPAANNLSEKIQHASMVVAISRYCASQCYRWSSPEHWKKIHVVRCGVSEQFLETTRTIDPSSQQFVSVARFAPQKGHLILIEALSQVIAAHPDTRLVLVGDGAFRGAIENRIAEMGLSDCVTFPGWLDEAGVRSAIEASRALVVPSFAEGLPVVIMEALALRRPVIATSVAGISEILEGGRHGWLVSPGDAGALAAAMVTALDASSEHLDSMAEAGHAFVRAHHNAATEAGRLADLIANHVPDAVSIERGERKELGSAKGSQTGA